MIGPSAIGSENGRPSSMTSAPASSRPRMRSTARSASGCPAVMYGISARRPAARSSTKRSAMRSRDPLAEPPRSDEIVRDADTIALGVFGLDDRSEEGALGVLVGQIHELAGKEQVTAWVGDDANDRTGQHIRQRIH